MSASTTKAVDRLRAELDRCPYNDFLRLEALSAGAGTAVVGLPYRPEFGLAKDGDLYHGGILAALVDITGHAVVALAIDQVAPTIDLRIDYLRPARGPRLLATGRLLNAGGSIARADVEVRDEDGRPVVSGRGTFSTS